jgi:hypothetical protein
VDALNSNLDPRWSFENRVTHSRLIQLCKQV